jgi:hypothetical protein
MAFESLLLLKPDALASSTGLDLGNTGSVRILPPCKCTLVAAQLFEGTTQGGTVIITFESPAGTNVAVMNLSNTTANTVVSVAPSAQVVLSPNVPVLCNVRDAGNAASVGVPRLLVSYSPETLENLSGTVALRDPE